jgi:signal transduction histidine kinase
MRAVFGKAFFVANHLFSTMATQPFGRSREARGQRHAGPPDQRGGQAPGRVDGERDAAMLRLTEEQMLVNQALVEKIFACERAEIALRQSERKLHDLLAHQHVTREDERKQISRRLHDSLAQNLLALRLDIVMMHQQTTGRHDRLRDRIGAALDNIDVTLRSVKELLGELRPAGLDLGLLATIEMELRKFTRASAIACDLRADPGLNELVLDEEDVLTVHRVLQEALNNVCRHSLASRVHVQLEAGPDSLSLTIADNGIGFDQAAPRKPNSYGLLDLAERVATQGGHLVVTSARGNGTDVRLHLPLSPASPIDPARRPAETGVD